MPHASPSLTPEEPDSLEAVDAVARSVHLCVRSLCMTEAAGTLERLALAAGLVDGLCDCLGVSGDARNLVAYVYTLLDGQSDNTLSTSRLMLALRTDSSVRVAYMRGRREAASVVEYPDLSL